MCIGVCSDTHHFFFPPLSGADIVALDEDSYTPLLVAAAHGQTEALQKLLDRGAPIDDLNKDGKSVVFVASEENHTEVLQVSILRNEDISLIGTHLLVPTPLKPV